MDRISVAIALVGALVVVGVAYALDSEPSFGPTAGAEYVVVYDPINSPITYEVASGHALEHLYDVATDRFLVDVPFGMPPGGGRLRFLDPIDSDAAQTEQDLPSSTSWPRDCLGPRPDHDGDGLLDECDPYPEDGPLGDWDDDGAQNTSDECPMLFNPGGAPSCGQTSGRIVVLIDDEGSSNSQNAQERRTANAVETLASLNARRQSQQLPPLAMPASTPPGSPLPPSVAAWCDERAAGRWSTAEYWADIPTEYGISADQQRRILDISRQLDARRQRVIDASEEGDWAGVLLHVDMTDFSGLPRELNGLVAPVRFSDLACRHNE